jgi:hypothetical protein
MRTTLDIDEDVLLAAKERARREKTTAGRVISQLLRQAMTQPPAGTGVPARKPGTRYGFRPFASRGTVVSDDLVSRLRDEEGI